MWYILLLSPSLNYSSNINCHSRQQGSIYGGNGGTPLGVHTPGPCQASRLPPHNPRLLVPPKHGHVSWLSTQHHKALTVDQQVLLMMQ